jgi:methionine-gamma-lyase
MIQAGRGLAFTTRAIHQGYCPREAHGALNPPVYLSSTFAFDSVEQGQARFAGEQEGFIYARVGNPTNRLLEERLANLEGGEAGLVFSSGMGAITSVMWSLVVPGDEIVADQTLYGCTFAFFNHGLKKFGVRVVHLDLTDPKSLAQHRWDRTKLVFFESPANPNMRVIDISAVADIAHGHGAQVVVDNTYCSPYLQRPLEFGADLVVHSATKYLGGHGDLMAGAVIGKAEVLTGIRMCGLKDMTGAVLSAQDAYLVLRGLKTLALRMERHCGNAQAIAELLASHPAVEVVAYPGLRSFAQYDLAKRQMLRPGGLVAFELKGGLEAARCFMNGLNLIARAVSLGDAETLVQHPASMTHSFYTKEERTRHFIGEGLIRISAGLEDIEDLKSDIVQALERIGPVTNLSLPRVIRA